MFKKVALILAALASLTIGNVYAIDPAFLGTRGNVLTHIDATLIVLRADQSSVRASWMGRTRSGSSRIAHEATFYMTNKTAFSGGSRSDVVKGQNFHIAYHFEGDLAIADTITFVAPNDGITRRNARDAIDAAFKRVLGE
jgi:hypothetical protein